MLGNQLSGNLCGPVIYPAIYAGLSSTRRSSRICSIYGDHCGPTIYLAIFAGLSSTRRTMRSYHLSGDLCGSIIHLAIYAGLSSIRPSLRKGAIYANEVCTQQSLCGHISLAAPMPICAPAQCPSTNHGRAPLGCAPLVSPPSARDPCQFAIAHIGGGNPAPAL